MMSMIPLLADLTRVGNASYFYKVARADVETLGSSPLPIKHPGEPIPAEKERNVG